MNVCRSNEGSLSTSVGVSSHANFCTSAVSADSLIWREAETVEEVATVFEGWPVVDKFSKAFSSRTNLSWRIPKLLLSMTGSVRNVRDDFDLAKS